MTDPAGKTPVRIELATSEIESGPCRAWADPVQVMAATAISVPNDSFAHYVEPRLEELSHLPTEGATDELPATVRDLVDRLQQSHARLFRDNRVGPDATSRSVRITCAVGEEDRVYFVKASSTWVGLLRDGVTHLVEDLSELQTEHAGLGGSEKLRLEVTSLPVQPGDVVVMLAAEEESAPDLRAVASVFSQTHDLKRACDGLVNLLGLQSEGAAAVAFRFVPIASSIAEGEENPIASLTAEFDAQSAPVQGAVQPSAAETGSEPGTSEAESFLDSLGVANVVAGRFSDDVGSIPSEGNESVPVAPGPPESSRPTAVEPEEIKNTDPVSPTPTSSDPAAADSSVEPVVEQPPVVEEPPMVTAAVAAPTAEAPVSSPQVAKGPDPVLNRDYHRGRNMLWPVMIAVVLGLGVGLAAVPGGGLKKFLPANSVFHTPTGELVVEPNPPAQAVFIDGIEVAQGTPAHFPELSAGRHTVQFDLGACGMWEDEVEVPEGESFHFSPQITGSVTVTVADPSRAGKVWADGGEQQALPAQLTGLPVGWNRIFYEDEKLPIWDQQVLVRSDKSVALVVPNNLRKGEGLFRIESLTYVEGRGLMESPQDSVFIDDSWAGLTPLESRVEPGLHSVRIRSQKGDVHTEMLEIHSAGTRYVVAQFGMGSRPVLHHRAPGRVELQGSLVLTMEVGLKSGEAISRAMLHFPDLDSASREIALSQVDKSRSVYVGILEPRNLPVSRDVRYYFTVQSGSGETIFSDLYTLVVNRKAPASRTQHRKVPQTPVAAPKSHADLPPSVVAPKKTVAATPAPVTSKAQPAIPAPRKSWREATRASNPVVIDATDTTDKNDAPGAEAPSVRTSVTDPVPDVAPVETDGDLPSGAGATNPELGASPDSLLGSGLVPPTPPQREIMIRK